MKPFRLMAGLPLCLLFMTVGVSSGTVAPPHRAGDDALANGEFDANLDGVSIHYAVHGSGPVVMVLPNSWGLTHTGLRPLFQPLEKDFTWVYFDPRGMGGSAPAASDEDLSMATIRRDLEELRKHLGLEKTNVLGWSNGGRNLLLFASEHPESVAAAIVLHSTANFTPEDAKRIQTEHPALTKAFGKLFGEMAQEGLTESERNQRQKAFVIEEWFPNLFANPDFGRKTLRVIYKDAEFSWRHFRYSNQVDGRNFDARPNLPRIQCRTLVVAGRHDLAPPEKVKEVHEGIPNSEFVVFENSAHYSPIEEPERFAQVLKGFLQGQ